MLSKRQRKFCMRMNHCSLSHSGCMHAEAPDKDIIVRIYSGMISSLSQLGHRTWFLHCSVLGGWKNLTDPEVICSILTNSVVPSLPTGTWIDLRHVQFNWLGQIVYRVLLLSLISYNKAVPQWLERGAAQCSSPESCLWVTRDDLLQSMELPGRRYQPHLCGNIHGTPTVSIRLKEVIQLQYVGSYELNGSEQKVSNFLEYPAAVHLEDCNSTSTGPAYQGQESPRSQ